MNETEQEIAGLMHAWMVAAQQKDLAALERLLGPEFIYSASGHGRQTRAEWFAVLPRYAVERFEFIDMDVHQYGDTAVVLSHYRQEATVGGTPRSGDFLITDVWVKRDGNWQVVARSSVMQPAPSA